MIFKLISPHNSAACAEDKAELLALASDIYDGPNRGLNDESRYWLYAKHSDYGIVGGVSLKPAEHTGLMTADDDMLADFSSQTPKGWSATHLFFYLPEDIIDEMDNDELKSFLHLFYSELYRALLELGSSYNIPYFSLIATLSEHISAAQIGLLPFDYETPFSLKGEDYILSFLSGSSQCLELFQLQEMTHQHNQSSLSHQFN